MSNLYNLISETLKKKTTHLKFLIMAKKQTKLYAHQDYSYLYTFLRI